MLKRNDALTDRGSRDREITTTMTGRKSGTTISLLADGWLVQRTEKANRMVGRMRDDSRQG